MKNAGVQRMGVGGGGCLGVAQVVLAVSIEGSRGSRICGEGAARRGHGGISCGNNRKANWFWQVRGAGSNAALLQGRRGNIQQNYEIITGTIQEQGEARDPSWSTGPAGDPQGPRGTGSALMFSLQGATSWERSWTFTGKWKFCWSVHSFCDL